MQFRLWHKHFQPHSHLDQVAEWPACDARLSVITVHYYCLVTFPGHSQILSRCCGENSHSFEIEAKTEDEANYG